MFNNLNVITSFLLIVSALAFAGDNPVGIEEGDAIYRNVTTLGMVNHHSAMFTGMYTFNGNWNMQVVEQLGSSSTNPPSGADIVSEVKNRQSHWILFKPITHNPADIDDMRETFKDKFKKGDNNFYVGSFNNLADITIGVLGPWERLSIQAKSTEIFNTIDATYCFTDLFSRRETWHYCCWYTWDNPHINHINEVRCDFFPEWAFESLGFKVWKNCQNSSLWNCTLSRESNESHNDALNGDYQCQELFPEIQNGCKNANGNNSQDHTTFRNSIVEAPDVKYVGMWGGQFNVYGGENGVPIVYVAIEYSYDGTNWGWVQDDAGIVWKYNQLWCNVNSYISNNYCNNSTPMKRCNYDFYFPVNPWTKYNANYVRAVVLDQGSNYTSIVLSKYLGQDQNFGGFFKNCN